MHKILGAIERQDYPKNKTCYYFIVNDSTDKTEEIIRRWIVPQVNIGNVKVDVVNEGKPADQRVSGFRERFIRPYVYQYYDKCLAQGLKWGCDYVFLMGSDTYLSDSKTISGLVNSAEEHRIDCLSPFMIADFDIGCTNIFKRKKFLLNKDVLYQWFNPKVKGIFTADFTSGAYLFSKHWIENAPKWFNPDLDTTPEYNYPERCREAGFKFWVDTNIQVIHLYGDAK